MCCKDTKFFSFWLLLGIGDLGLKYKRDAIYFVANGYKLNILKS